MRSASKILASLLVLCLASFAVPAQTVWADDETPGSTQGSDVDTQEVTANTPLPDMLAMQEKVVQATAVYDEATKKVTEVEKEIADANKRIEELQEKLPDARERSNTAAKEYYRMLSTSNVFAEMVFGATSLSDFLTKVEYSARANQSFLDDIASLSELNEQLETERSELEAQKSLLDEEQLHAEEALRDAESARDAAEETARKIAELTAAATAAAAAAAAAEAPTPQAPVQPSPGGSTSPASPGTPEAPSDKQAFVDLWAPRIDAYMAGSPLAGYGYAFASAAYDYNVDPRWSPAIACLESSKGLYCFRSHNAWGWGQVDWPDWETAIYAHVYGLSRGYGYTISEAAAKKYCPGNWQHWFNVISSEMSRSPLSP